MNEVQFDSWNERKKSLNKVKLIRKVSVKKRFIGLALV
ncbi:hypothetical protein C1336_000780019 [Campylobacter jejuni subsp. jejuni 1336]|nr:hypothetical protein C1336_000780019 [Campylobacter jejuni subsp. jejuni 1336]